ncbi:alpha-galactosidase [Schaalia sp. 19OD2882]|uniref:alpha-galactosidase n=1 Tax=Schaalia sp. 19OD2882 TaxID=2794089 RepID=UPI001C1F072B|nr:alpha-galactosidase [Schaalia sp. 19OD2882]QWW19430.1 alpha-galactosidase [Schaalia sp. 19OD2882]
MSRTHVRLVSPTPAPRPLRGAEPTELVLSFDDDSLPRIVYWGEAVMDADERSDEAAGIDLVAVERAQVMAAGVEEAEAPSLLPTQAEGWTGTPMLSVHREGVEIHPLFTVSSVRSSASTCTVEAEDRRAGLALRFDIEIDEFGLVHHRAALTNTGGDDLAVHRLWLTLPLPADTAELATHTGHHMRERSAQRHPLVDGLFAKETWVGRPDFDATTLILAGESGFGFEKGAVRAAHLAWSGNSTHFAVRTPYTHGLIGAGELLAAGEAVLGPGCAYTTPDLIASWAEGVDALASRYHDLVRSQHPGFAAEARPVTLNTWEAFYFDHDIDKMTRLARIGAEIGVERFVVDDGWFAGRRDDTRALGDWEADADLWPHGLRPLSDLVHSLGMEFGVWVEPEMISPDSRLARSHPDWILRPAADRLPLAGRHQQVLDLANPHVEEHILDTLSALVEREGIDYLKWDHNRFVIEALSPATRRPAVHDQTLALYRIIDALKEGHPGLEIESCASGGGRIDLAILSRTDRVWASDCTDPLERVDIQRGTSLLVPPEMIGAHIAQSPSHMTGRATSLSTRAAVALTGHLGIEWNLLDADEADFDRLRRWVDLHKTIRGLDWCAVHADTADPAIRVDGLVSAQGRSIWRFTALATSQHYPYGLIRLPGLRNALHRIRPFGGPELYETMAPAALSALEWWNDEGALVPGAVLSRWGIRPPHLLPGSAVLIEVEEV